VQTCWDDLASHYPRVELDALVVMPNHVHGIIFLIDREVDEHGQNEVAIGPHAATSGTQRAGLRPAPTGPGKQCGLSEVVRAFKSFSSRRVNEFRQTPGVPVWQRNYYEHVIRSAASLDAIRRYIIENPQRWALDEENPVNASSSR
jgi:REP element-mobilizing transposase RayT